AAGIVEVELYHVTGGGVAFNSRPTAAVFAVPGRQPLMSIRDAGSDAKESFPLRLHASRGGSNISGAESKTDPYEVKKWDGTTCPSHETFLCTSAAAVL
ncbi:hypothetical protein GW17_00052085, partial [Ensete ventricosum]